MKQNGMLDVESIRIKVHLSDRFSMHGNFPLILLVKMMLPFNLPRYLCLMK